MEPLILLIEPELDQRAATATMSRAQKVYEEGARDISRVMRTQITEGTTAAGRGFEEMETKARRAYLSMQDAGEKVAAAERKLEAARERGASNTEALARRVERARLDEIQAIERATNAYRDYENAAQNAGQAGENAGQSILGGLRDAVSGAGQSGGDMANEFVGGFAGSSALLRLGAAAGPIGLALAGVAALGLTAGKVLADNLAAGLQSMQMKDLFQTRLGVDDATMAQYGASAAKAYTDMWGASVEDNLSAVQFGVQGGVIAPDASDAEIQNTIAQLQTLAQVMEVDVQEAARAAGQLMRGGFAADGTQAADIIATGFQNGLDISGDWLDTITEYSTQFRKLGLDGGDAIGLISQGLEGGARDSDKVADSLKEFSIRAVDGSKLTAEGFAAIGLQADDMAGRFLAGGESARTAFATTLQAIRGLDDPIQQAMTWQALFGTQWEDMGDAINNMDLSTARAQFSDTEGAIDSATQKLSEHTNGWDQLGRNIDTTFGKLQKWLADTAIGEFLSQGLPGFFNNMLDPNFGNPTAGYQSPDATPTPLNPLDILSGGPGSSAPSGPGGLLMPGLNGPPPPGAPGAAAPVPGARTPILTETQRAAQEAASGGTGLPGAPSLPLQYTNTAGLPANIANATTRLDEARHDVAEKEARVNQLMQSNNADADDIQKARNDLAKAQQSQMQAEQSLMDARINATEKANKQLTGLSNDMSELGNQLDADFGLSKGLGGFLENVVKAVGNALTAPLMAALGMVEKANPNEGSGLMGIMAANGAFGSQYTPGSIAATQVSGTSGGPQGYSAASAGSYGAPVGGGAPYGLPGSTNTGGYGSSGAVFPDWVHALEQQFGVKASTYSGHQTDNRSEAGYAPNPNGENRGIDWSGPVDAMQRFADYLSQVPGALEQVIWQNPSTGQATEIAGGQPQPGYFSGDLGGHQDHVHTRQSAAIPVPGGMSIPALSAPSPAYTGVSPGLPTVGAGGGGWFPGLGMPQSPVFGGGMPGIGSGIGQAGAPGVPQPGVGGAIGAGQGGAAYPSTGGNSGNVLGGMAMDGLMAATAGLDMMMPGAGAAAKIGIQLANRTVGYAAQNAGIIGSGVLETLSLGDNPKGSLGASWLGKGLGGIAGAAAALPNIAGGKPPGPMTQQGGGQQGGGTTINQNDQSIHVKNEKATEDQTGKVIAEHQQQMFAPAGRQP